MESTLGKHHNSHLKLSDFIDENFFEDIDSSSPQIDPTVSNLEKDKLPVNDLILSLIKKQDVVEHLIEVPNNKKRVKTGSQGSSSGSEVNKYLVFSPILGLLLHLTHNLTSKCWK